MELACPALASLALACLALACPVLAYIALACPGLACPFPYKSSFLFTSDNRMKVGIKVEMTFSFELGTDPHYRIL